MFEAEKRFCKDENLSIKLFQAPYFCDRLKLFGYYDKYLEYVEMINKEFCGNEQDFLEYYNKTKDRIIDYIKSSEAFTALNSCDMEKFEKKFQFPDKDNYRETYVGHKFISIDMVKANFTALVSFGKLYGFEFFDDYDYTKFVSKFTKNEHIINSKYIRQVVFGNCNPKRQIAYESFLMESLLKLLFSLCMIKEEQVFALRSDEIVLLADDFTDDEIRAIQVFLESHSKKAFPIHFEVYTLGRIVGSQAYIKKFDTKFVDKDFELKCLNPDEAPFIYRYLKNESITDNDMVFEYNGKLAKFLKAPEYTISYEQLSN